LVTGLGNKGSQRPEREQHCKTVKQKKDRGTRFEFLEKKGNLGAEKGEEKNNGSRQIMEDTAGQGHSAKDSPKVTQCMPCRIPKGKVGKMS
jgi:hypothetical protein